MSVLSEFSSSQLVFERCFVSLIHEDCHPANRLIKKNEIHLEKIMHLGNTDAGKKECIENSFLLINRNNSFKNIFTDYIDYFVILQLLITCKTDL